MYRTVSIVCGNTRVVVMKASIGGMSSTYECDLVFANVEKMTTTQAISAGARGGILSGW